MMTTAIRQNPLTAAGDDRGDALARWAMMAWLVFAIALVVKAMVEPVKHSVYPCFELAARGWAAEENIYEFWRGFRYSPAFAMLFQAFAALPARLGGALWNLLNVALLFASLRLLARDVLPGHWSDRARGIFLLLALAGSVRGLWAAQTTSLCFAFAGFAAWGIVRRRWWLASLCLAIPVYVKLWPIAFALLALCCWPRPLIGRFALCMLLPAAVPFLSKPPHVVLWQYANWVEFLTGPCQQRWAAYRDFWTILTACRVPPSPLVYLILQLATAAAVAGWCFVRRLKGESDRGLLAFTLAIWAAWQLLFGPGTERNTYGLAAPVIAWGVIASFGDPRRWRLAVAAWSVNVLFGGTGAFERIFDRALYEAEAVTPAGVLLLVIWLATLPIDRSRPPGVIAPEGDSSEFADPETTHIWRSGKKERSTAAA